MHKFFYYGYSKEELQSCSPQIENYSFWIDKTISIIGTIAMLCLFIVSLFFVELEKFRYIYLGFTIGFGVLSVLSFFLRNDKFNLGRPGLYIICTMLYAFGILLALQYPDQKATIIQIMIVLLPMFIIDRPLRIYIYEAVVLITYILIVVFLQDKSIAFKECFNAVSLTLLAMVSHWIMAHSRIKGFIALNDNQKIISQLTKVQEELKHTSESDALTGLLNRRKLYETLSQINNGEVDVPKGILMIDIDHFKNINDKYGHSKGDYILSTFSSELLQLSKEQSITAYRYGGDEFIVLAYNGNDEKLAELSKKIHLIGKDTFIDKGKSLSLSIGISLYKNSEKLNCEQWVEEADKAAYQAKENGRGQSFWSA